MGVTRRKFDADFREGAVRLVRETGKPIAQVARDLGINEGTLGNWVNADERPRGEGSGTPGFTLSEHHDAAAAYDALAMAITVRGGKVPGVTKHTDQGSEYTARRSRLPASGWG
jgi:transposase-like protein